MRSLELMGDAFKISALPRSGYARGKHYPASVGYGLAWYSDCKCTHYTGKPFLLR